VNDAVMRILIDETVARAAGQTPVPLIMPATVVDGSDPLQVSVLVDGDIDPVLGQSVVGAVFDGARVMVTFNPPAGLLITGWVPDPLMAWQEVTTFLNAWANFSPTTDTVARYRLEPCGVVRMQGLISGGVLGSSAFTLPEALWPVERFIYSPVSGGVGGRLDVNPDGSVVPVAASNAFFGLNCEWTIGE
jgi:hypothetical protein